MDVKKRCPDCERWLPESEFFRDGSRPSGRQVYCKACYTLRVVSANAARRERLEATGFAGADHGKVGTYRDGCRCEDCRKANAEAMRRSREKAWARDDFPHGTMTGYAYKCRCEKCRKAMRAYKERMKLRKGI